VAASQWLHAPSVEYLIPLVVATVAALVTSWLVRDGPRWWAIASSLALAAAAILAVPAQRDLVAVERNWDAWRVDASTNALRSLQLSLDAAVESSERIAHEALGAPADRIAAFARLGHLVDDDAPVERAVVVYRGDSAIAWAGTTRLSPDLNHEGLTVLATSFYLALQVVQREGDTRAAVITLVGAAPPADRLSAPLANRVATESGISVFNFDPPSDSSSGAALLRYENAGRRLFDVRSGPLLQGEVAQRLEEQVRARAGAAFLVALACFIIGVWRGTRLLSRRVAALAVGLSCTALVPLNQYSNLTRLFDPALYFTPKGGPLTGNAGALATTSALVLLGVLAVFRRRSQPVPRWGAMVTIVLVAGLGPFLLRDLARGVQVPPHGVDTSLWLIWEIPLFLAAVSVLLAGAAAGAAVLGPRRGLSPWVAPTLAAIAGVTAPAVWEAPAHWPWWYTLLWTAAIAMLALSRRTRYVILSASTVAAVGATTLVWGRTAKGRVDAAERDVVGLGEIDSVAVTLLHRFGDALIAEPSPASRQALLQRYVTSDLASAGNPVALSAWPSDSGPSAQFATANLPIPRRATQAIVAQARQIRAPVIVPVATDTAFEVVMAAPSPDGGVTAVVLGPKSRVFETDAFARLVGLDVDSDAEPPYTVRLHDVPATIVPPSRIAWRREGSELHGDWAVHIGELAKPAHLEVELRPTYALAERGALLVLLDLAIVGVLWLASVVADGGAGRWLRARRRSWGRSYRARLSLALFVFFIVPASAFAVWSYGNLATDATQSRTLLVNETLRALQPPPGPHWLPAESDRLDTPLFLYRAGELVETSDPLYDDLAPIGRYLRPPVELSLDVRDEETAAQLERVDGATALFGYRGFTSPVAPPLVIAAPARADELALGRRRRDLGVLVLFATAIGALAALWLSGIAARQLSSPIRTLADAALSLAGGGHMPSLERAPTIEFAPVFTAFRRMESDLSASRRALEEAQRRTAAVLRNVASGVVAVDPDLRVALANPRAETLLGGSLAPGTAFDRVAAAPIAERVALFLTSPRDEEEFEVALEQQQLHGTLTRLSRGGVVVTLDDVTELARAQRVLAWGEMARQVAHEIKNPLTPIRLGVQHLRRARSDPRVDFDRVLEHNVNQILAEIDRLDEIARSFSRYGAAPQERAQASAVDVAAIVREVVSLERMGDPADLEWHESNVDAPVFALARGDELKEVLLNVLENARHAQSTRVGVQLTANSAGVTLAVRDNGQGIPPDVLPRIFEPHFSTRTSGSGLGLAISRRLVESWGGEVTVESEPGRGTIVTIRLRAAERRTAES
jgi:two-component system, NtrC family, nitrogen regulation sensor histidine kinase NtrY